MLVSHLKKFIYVKTVKTAGTSTESYFERYCMLPGEWSQDHPRPMYISAAGIIGQRGPYERQDLEYWNHMPAHQIKQRVGDVIWSEYFKFCVIRNPYDKEVGAFYHFNGKGPYPRITNIKRDQKDFEEYQIMMAQELPITIEREHYMIDGTICMDDFIRYETLQADIKRVGDKLGIPWEPQYIPKFKVGIRPLNALTHLLYTDVSKKLVADRYALELDMFNYTFPQK